jgi:CRISPR-associated protein Csm5
MQVQKPVIIKAQLLSPLSVGDGNALSPLADYFVQNGYLHYISPDRLETYLDENQLITAYVKAVRSAVNVAKDSFWEDTLQMDDLDLISSGRKARIYVKDNPTEVKTIVRNGNAPYLPGSTVKGAFKTALLYGWLFQQDKRELKKLLTLIKESEKFEIEKQLDSLLNSRFNEKGVMPDFHHLRVSDSSLFSDSDVEVLMSKRLHLIKGTFDIPIAREAIVAPNKVFGIPVTLYPQFQHSSLQFLNKDGLKGMFKLINDFSLDHLGWLLDEVEASRQDIEKGTPGMYNPLFNWLDNLYKDIDKASDDECFIQIGAGKTYFANSIGLAIRNNDRRDFDKWRKILRLGKLEKEFYPVTISIDQERSAPLGWAMLKLG